MSMSREEEIRAAALMAAARGAVNPGVVIANAKRFSHYIINGTDLNEVPVVVPPKTETWQDSVIRDEIKRHSYGCAFLDSRGFCTCGADPDLMPVRRRSDNEACPECGCASSAHTEKGCRSGRASAGLCLCQLANGKCGKVGCTDHG